MPPHSKSLKEEGAVFKTFKLVKDGEFQEEGAMVIGQDEFSKSYVKSMK